MGKAAVLGAGSWGTALAILLESKGWEVSLYSRRAELAEEIRNLHQNSRYLPGVLIPRKVRPLTDIPVALDGASLVIFAVPSHAFRSILKTTLPHILKDALIINASKGLEEGTLLRMSQIFAEEAGIERKRRYVALSGPSHAEEVGRFMPTAIVTASEFIKTAEEAQEALMTVNFRVYTNEDLPGVEIGGALKNIVALGTGIADGLGFGDNTRAALMTRGLAEITRLGVKMGADPLTFAGLAGVGDLIVTCTSEHSRNRQAGRLLGQGLKLSEALEKVNMVVEGVRTTMSAYKLAKLLGVEMPITAQIYRVLFEGLQPFEAVNNLMQRERRTELYR